MESLASEVRMEMTGKNVIVSIDCLSVLPISTAGTFYQQCQVVRKGNWLVEGKGRPGMIGQVHEEKGIAVLYPNPHVHVKTLYRLLTNQPVPN